MVNYVCCVHNVWNRPELASKELFKAKLWRKRGVKSHRIEGVATRIEIPHKNSCCFIRWLGYNGVRGSKFIVADSAGICIVGDPPKGGQESAHKLNATNGVKNWKRKALLRATNVKIAMSSKEIQPRLNDSPKWTQGTCACFATCTWTSTRSFGRLGATNTTKQWKT